MKEDGERGVFAQEDWPWPGQLRAGDGAVGGRFGLKDDPERGVFAQEDWPWPGQLRAGDGALAGRFALKEDGERGVFAQEDWPWPGQLRAGDGALGGRFEPKFIAGFMTGARVPAALALKKELPIVRPAAALILREPFEAAVRPPKKEELLVARAGNPPNLPDEPPV